MATLAQAFGRSSSLFWGQLRFHAEEMPRALPGSLARHATVDGKHAAVFCVAAKGLPSVHLLATLSDSGRRNLTFFQDILFTFFSPPS